MEVEKTEPENITSKQKKEEPKTENQKIMERLEKFNKMSEKEKDERDN